MTTTLAQGGVEVANCNEIDRYWANFILTAQYVVCNSKAFTTQSVDSWPSVVPATCTPLFCMPGGFLMEF